MPIENRVTFGEWAAQRQPSVIEAILAYRAVLRVLPLVCSANPEVILESFRSAHAWWTRLCQADSQPRIPEMSRLSNPPDDEVEFVISALDCLRDRKFDLAISHASAAEAFGRRPESKHIWSSVQKDAEAEDQWAEAATQGWWVTVPPLWLDDVRGDPKYRVNFPPWARASWDRFKSAGPAKTAQFGVWVRWYEQRLMGKASFDGSLTWGQSKAVNLTIVHQPDGFWQREPREINSDIRGLLDLAREGQQRDSAAIELVAEANIPTEPLPEPSPATRFTYANGQFDVVPPTSWEGKVAQAAMYHDRARSLAAALAQRLENTDAVPDVKGSVDALIGVLGDRIEGVQPDQLRLASRAIAARARAYGHPSAEFEISADAIAALFELSDALTDLQAFAKSELEEHEYAVRQLDLTLDVASQLKSVLDELTEGLLAAPEIVSERVEMSFESAAIASDAALQDQVRIAIEGDRSLLAGNLALAVARALGNESQAGLHPVPKTPS